MLYAADRTIRLCLGGKVKSVDDSATLKPAKGVKQTIPIDLLQAFSRTTFLAAGRRRGHRQQHVVGIQGTRTRSRPDRDNGAHAVYNSPDYKKQLQETARQPGKVV